MAESPDGDIWPIIYAGIGLTFILLLLFAGAGPRFLPLAAACNCTVEVADSVAFTENLQVFLGGGPQALNDHTVFQDHVTLRIDSPTGLPGQPPIGNLEEVISGENLGGETRLSPLWTGALAPFGLVIGFLGLFIGVGIRGKALIAVFIFLALGFAWVGIFGVNSGWIILVGLLLAGGAAALLVSRFASRGDD